jgi:hypothetical protein
VSTGFSVKGERETQKKIEQVTRNTPHLKVVIPIAKRKLGTCQQSSRQAKQELGTSDVEARRRRKRRAQTRKWCEEDG